MFFIDCHLILVYSSSNYHIPVCNRYDSVETGLFLNDDLSSDFAGKGFPLNQNQNWRENKFYFFANDQIL